MLGCLKLSVEDCITAYDSISREIFKAERFGKLAKLKNLKLNGEFYDSHALELKIQEIITNSAVGNGANAKLFNDDEKGCKV